MTYYAVIDTNVVVSSMLKRDSIPWRVVDLATKGIITALLNEEILNEYRDVLMRNEFELSPDDVDELIRLLCERGLFLDRTETSEPFADPDDVVFFEIAMTARKTMDAYLITGNKRHFPLKTFVVTPREMLDIIEA